jgi:hypothetical protein
MSETSQNQDSATKGSDDILSQLEKLASLKEKGILSESEFNEQKQKLLGKKEISLGSKLKKHKWKIIIGIIILIPIFTNPTDEDFKKFKGGKQVSNYFFFSVYEETYCTVCSSFVNEDGTNNLEYNTITYYGFLGNFFRKN